MKKWSLYSYLIPACILAGTIVQATSAISKPAVCTTGDQCYKAALEQFRRGDEKSLNAAKILFRKAASFYTKECESGSADACKELWPMYSQGRGVEPDDGESERIRLRAFVLYERDCQEKPPDKKTARSCANLANLYFWGDGVKRDVKKAFRISRSACQDGSAMGCHNLAVHYQKGWGTQKRIGLAIRYYRKACELREEKKWSDEIWGCENLEQLCREHESAECNKQNP
jgi:TPR repeat protein